MKKKSKKKQAVAIKYDVGYTAPRIIAKGKGLVAENIIDTAKNSGVHIEKDSLMSKELMKIEIGNEIPEALYSAVAGVLAFVYKLDEEKGVKKSE